MSPGYGAPSATTGSGWDHPGDRTLPASEEAVELVATVLDDGRAEVLGIGQDY